MERVKSRSESPFSQSKGKNHSSNVSENGSRVHEQLKSKKKNQKGKNKHQANGKENEDIGSNGQDYMDKEQATSHEIDTKSDSNDTEHKNEVNGVGKFENENIFKQENESNSNENNGSNIVYEISEEVTVAQADCQPNEDETKEESDSIKEDINVDENSSENDSFKSNIETENSAKKEIVLPECKVVIEAFDEIFNQGTQNIVKTETNGVTQDQEPTEECSLNKEVSQVGLNNSNDSLSYEKPDITQQQIQASPDTATKDDYFFPSKITSFLGSLTCSSEQKQDSEISSSKKIEKTALNHPYLSKVSGRRGIKERLNSSATVFSSQEEEAKTPENMGISLDDSFRVRTNPSRLYSADLDENPTLRKFKGKRCLNAGDEPEGMEDEYLGTIKRRKLDEKMQVSGILGSIMWSPFKKRSLENENQLKLSTTESKLSRLLSPFWFWKKTTESQKRK